MAEDLGPLRALPPAERQTCRNSISKKFALVLILILVLAVANVFVVHSLLRDLNGVAETVNVAGKLRMLSQKVAFEATKALHGGQSTAAVLDHALNDLDTALSALANGGPAFGFELRPLAQHQRFLLDATRTDWGRYRSQVESAMGSAGTDSQHAIAAITENAGRLLEHAELLVTALTLDAQRTQRHALVQLYALLAVNGVVLAMIFIAVRNQIVRPLRKLAEYSRDFAEGRYHGDVAYASQDEIGVLAASFNESVRQVNDMIARIEQDRRNLIQAEGMFRGFAENSVVGVYIAQNGRFRFVNRKMAQMFAYEADEMVHSVAVLDLAPEGEKPAVEENIRRRLQGELSEVHYERQARRKDGSLFDVEVFGSLMNLDGGSATIGIMLDVSERKRLDLALRVLSACNRALVRATDEAALLDEVCRIVRDISGYPFVWVGFAEDDAARTVRPAALAEIEPGALLSTIDHITWDESPTGRGATGAAIRRGEVVVIADMQTNSVLAPWRDFMVRHAIVSAMSLPLRSGSKVFGALTVYASQGKAFGPQEVRVAEELADNLAYGIMALRADSARRDYERQLEYHARHDILTGLANRSLLQEHLNRAIAKAARTGHPIWVIFIDLDRFKFVNDSLGHKAGDSVLLAISQRLQQVVRETDTVSRLGGDEFVLVLPEPIEEVLATSIVLRVMEAIAVPILVDGHEFVLGCSIGVAVYPDDGVEPETLIRNADIAMYRAKESGRNNFQFYTAAMNERLVERLRIEADLRSAIEREEFVLHYQPQIDLRTGRMIGVEALVRWQHPTMGLVPPLRFIGLAEETGLIVPIGDWVMHTACAQAKAWEKAGLGALRVAVNLSARQFAQQNLALAVANVLTDTGLAPGCLELELTESLVMSDLERAIATLSELKSLGVMVSLDDFGTGHSSLAYLKRLPIDTLKIDQSFIRDVAHVADDAAIVASIISLAQNLGRGVIAEGVETREQIDYLRGQGCHQMQGFFFSQPLAANAIEGLLRDERWNRPSGQAGLT